MIDRLLELALFYQGVGPIIVSVGVVWMCLQSLGIVFNSLIQPLLPG